MSDTTDEVTEETTTPPPAPPVTDAPAEETDWKAEARKWEKLAKQNNKAAAELEKVQTAAMSDQEKAVAAARAEGAAETARTYGSKLAAAEFRAAAASKGLDLSEVADLVDVSKFLGDDGEPNSKAIKAAVDKLAKLAPAKGRSGGDFGGAPQSPPASLDDQIAEAQKRRDFAAVIYLKRQQAAAQNT